jgi:hypothetical protein
MNRSPSRLVPSLVAAIVLLAVLVSAGPTLVQLAHAAVPLVIAFGVVAVLLRLVWWFTNRI